MKEITIGANEEGKRLDSFLKSYLKEASGSFIYKMLRKKNITLNNKKADGKEKLSSGDSIKLFFSDETFEKFRGQKESSGFKNLGDALKTFGEFPVVFEDDNIVLVNKPWGVLSQRASQDDLSLNEWLIDYLYDKGELTKESLSTYRPSICNRLDRNTSGLIICAKTLIGARKMNEIIKDRSVEKYYRTIVTGRIKDGLSLKGFLKKDEKTNKVTIKDKDPKDDSYSYIETEYEPVEYIKDTDLTLLEVKLVTGKPHQIRAHLASIGHPIIGDVKYGGKKIKGLNTQLLHSYRLVFPDNMGEPFTDIEGREFIAQLPDKFKEFLE
ncbi:RluA family pseudouridine synthase [Butyrivibrio sp. AE2032]|uniref:RluA family pseudouridine synthase n=1 Tax=Butyrivibrio sp. AE2032 TaxID=1458463 RepID=UPI000552B8E3|nr:RluA family pseudouridine synthase [Butyrivibrio sp. AE2032]